jgi:hypothetical protein
MAIFRKVHTSFWEDSKIIDDMDIQERFLWLYLLTNPATNQIGCYEITYRKIIFETGLDKSTIEKLLLKFENNFKIIEYNIDNKEIFIRNWYKYNWTKSPKLLSCIKQEYLKIKTEKFISYIDKIMDEYYPDDLKLYRTANKSEIPQKTAIKVMQRDNFECKKCGSKDDLTIDHIFPKNLGGSNSIDNLRVLCRSCNSKRPTAGKQLIDELKKDGFDINDIVFDKFDTVSVLNRQEQEQEQEKEQEKEKEKEKEEKEEIKTRITPEHKETDDIIKTYSKYFNKSYRLSFNEKIEICNITNQEQYTLDDWELIFKNASKGWMIKNENVKPSLTNILENYSKFLNDDYNLNNEKDKPQILDGIDWSKINE